MCSGPDGEAELLPSLEEMEGERSFSLSVEMRGGVGGSSLSKKSGTGGGVGGISGRGGCSVSRLFKSISSMLSSDGGGGRGIVLSYTSGS